MVFAVESLSLDGGNISVDIRFGGNLADVYLKRCIAVSEKQAFSCRLHVLAVKYVMWGMKRMC
jgi:hypothetical protein